MHAEPLRRLDPFRVLPAPGFDRVEQVRATSDSMHAILLSASATPVTARSTPTRRLVPGVSGQRVVGPRIADMASSCETIVVGLGAMGSAAAYHLARRGHTVLGFDRFRPPHSHGSSHGETRIIREAYFEHPAYVPMVQRAYELWHELEQRSGNVLYRPTGGLMIGAAQSELVTGSLRSARQHGLAHELIGAGEIRQRFPALQPADDMVGVFESRAGVLFPERCIAAHLELAREAGADLRFDEPILGWESDDRGVRVFTHRGEYRARHLIATVGAWVGGLFPELAQFFAIERQTIFWFEAQATPDLFHRRALSGASLAIRRPQFLLWLPRPGRGRQSGAPSRWPDGRAGCCRSRGLGRRSPRHPHPRPPLRAARRRPVAKKRRVSLHEHPGRALLDRSPSGAPAGADREPVQRPRLQVRERDRRDRHRFGRRKPIAVRPFAVQVALFLSGDCAAWTARMELPLNCGGWSVPPLAVASLTRRSASR